MVITAMGDEHIMAKNKTTLSDINKTAQTASSILKLIYDEKKNNTSVSIPKLYSREYQLTIEQAFEILSNYGLKAVAVKTQLKEADIKFKNYFDNQVISTDPKAGQKVKPGDTILVKYITQEVINESQRLFEKSEAEKEQAEFNKLSKKIEQKEKRTQLLSEIINTTKTSIKKLPTTVKKKNNNTSIADEAIVIDENKIEIVENND